MANNPYNLTDNNSGTTITSNPYADFQKQLNDMAGLNNEQSDNTYTYGSEYQSNNPYAIYQQNESPTKDADFNHQFFTINNKDQD